MKALIYDIEILKAVPSRSEPPVPGIDYCEGWHDHANMGITVIGAYDYAEERYRVFCKDNIHKFDELCHASELLVSFNGIEFDDKVIAATASLVAWCQKVARYDLLRETWIAAGLVPTFQSKTHGGYGLDAICQRNFGTKKSGHGALAPVLWQRGEIGEVIDYCLNDVRLTKQLFDAVLAGTPIINPKDNTMLTLRVPNFDPQTANSERIPA